MSHHSPEKRHKELHQIHDAVVLREGDLYGESKRDERISDMLPKTLLYMKRCDEDLCLWLGCFTADGVITEILLEGTSRASFYLFFGFSNC